MEIRCRRAGGGFGGKFTNPARFAGVAAVAAVVTRRQVRLAANRNVDLAMIGGRCDADVTYSVGFNEEGRLLALDLHHVLTVRPALAFGLPSIETRFQLRLSIGERVGVTVVALQTRLLLWRCRLENF